MAINSTINASINKRLFKGLYSENTSLPVDLLLPRESSINHHAHKFAKRMHQLFNKVKSSRNDAYYAQKPFYNPKHLNQTFYAGDIVLLFT